mmetsp:Transcript_24873/g.36456  ORF Transcript_24873/g.36456 Transcript_24873/m.36456 type:complete len:91 (-) Transcript_24873:109-381(-)
MQLRIPILFVLARQLYTNGPTMAVRLCWRCLRKCTELGIPSTTSSRRSCVWIVATSGVELADDAAAMLQVQLDKTPAIQPQAANGFLLLF